MPNRTKLSTEITTLEQVIASARNRLNGLAEEDPTTRLLRDQLAELIAKREALTKALEDTRYAEEKAARRGRVFLNLIFIFAIVLALHELTERHFETGGTILATMVLFLTLENINIVSLRRRIRKYRRTHAGEHPGNGESGPGSP
jgi:hypothetical protein